ncbi:MAG TPA: site-2 protease family protein [Gemmatimonadaceae bacterium]|nr:site-2 protease family protein [Gemmatimonadaceae bacterium]
MKWSWKMGRVAGIDLRVHATFVLLLVWLAVVFYNETGTAAGVELGVAFTLALFASVIAHEYGHALVARHFGIATRDITLLPIGGVSRLEYIPEHPRQEFWIAISGPLVTLAIAVVLFGIISAAGLPVEPSGSLFGSAQSGAFLAQLMWVNVSLFVFNLLPAFPMDGGRVLRAILARRMPYLRASDAAASIGRGFALIFGVVGLLYDPLLALVALFVWLGAAGESQALHLKTALAGVTVEHVMVRDVNTIGSRETLDAALHHVLAGFQHDFPVVDDGRVLGVLTRDALIKALASAGRESLVGASMDRQFQVADPGEAVEKAFARLQQSGTRSAPVVRDGRLYGMLTLDNVGEFIMAAQALGGPVDKA